MNRNNSFLLWMKDMLHTVWSFIKKVFIKISRFIILIFYAVKKLFAGIFKNPKTGSETSEKQTNADFFGEKSKEKPVLSHTQVSTAKHQKVTSSNALAEVSAVENREHISIFKPREKRPNFIISIVLTSLKLFLVLIFMLGAGVFGLLWGVAKAYMETTPTLDIEKIENQSVNSHIYDANDQLITTFTGTENREWVALSDIPQLVQNAYIAVEDIRFRYHNGVDLKRLLGAFVSNVLNENVQGGSTITQQLIKIRLLTMEQTYKRKIQEAYLAMQLEQEYSKDEILETYLNTIPLGGTNYGVKAAAKDYFNKDLNQLTLREAACLAGVTQAPYRYSPRRVYYTSKDKEKDIKMLDDRINFVLKRMYEANFIDKAQYDKALDEKLTIMEKSSVSELYSYPYFVEYAISDVITQFLKQRNQQDTKENRAKIEDEIRTNGYKIYTTLDPAIQKTVQDTLSSYNKYPKLKNSGDSTIHQTNPDGSVTDTIQPQAAAVVYDYTKGELKAIVGGRDTPTVKKALNRAYQTSMPVGSSIKPLSVYAPAINLGYSPGSVVANVPVPISGWNTDKGYPATSSNTYGPVTLRTGLVKSLNIATARTLMDKVGINQSKNYLVSLGIDPNHIKADGPGLALGTSGITPVEMAVAYGAIANKGVYMEPFSFRRVEDKNGNIILDASKIRAQRQVFKPTTAWLVTNMLENAVSSGTGTKAKIKDMHVGGKTGTNQDNRGVFFAGITPYYSATVWIGHDKYKPLTGGIAASSTAAPLWREFMSKILTGKPNKEIIEDTPESLGLVRKKICTISGLLATDACEKDIDGHKPVDEWVDAANILEECSWHHTLTFCASTGKLANEFCPDKLAHSLVFPPGDSALAQWDKLNSGIKLPAEVFEPGFDTDSINASNPVYASLFCQVHTQQWYDSSVARPQAVQNAQKIINEVQSNISINQLMMTADEKFTLQTLISTLQTLIASDSIDAEQIEDKGTELKQAANHVFSKYNTQ